MMAQDIPGAQPGNLVQSDGRVPRRAQRRVGAIRLANPNFVSLPNLYGRAP